MKNPFKRGDIVKHKNPSIRASFRVTKVTVNQIKLVVASNGTHFGTFDFDDFELVQEGK